MISKRARLPEPDLEYRMVIPWANLVSDNKKFMHTRRHTLTTAYRAALLSIGDLARKQGVPYVVGPVVLVGHCWWPSEAIRDSGNYRKLIGDALAKIWFLSDGQVEDERWVKAGVDPAKPRMVVVMTPRVL